MCQRMCGPCRASTPRCGSPVPRPATGRGTGGVARIVGRAHTRVGRELGQVVPEEVEIAVDVHPDAARLRPDAGVGSSATSGRRLAELPPIRIHTCIEVDVHRLQNPSDVGRVKVAPPYAEARSESWASRRSAASETSASGGTHSRACMPPSRSIPSASGPPFPRSAPGCDGPRGWRSAVDESGERGYAAARFSSADSISSTFRYAHVGHSFLPRPRGISPLAAKRLPSPTSCCRWRPTSVAFSITRMATF